MDTLSNDQKATIARLAASGPIAVVEYRGEKPEIVEYIKKETGKKRFMVKHALACELLETGEQFPCELFTPRLAPPKDDDDQDRPELPPLTGLKRGTQLVLQIGGLAFNQGVVTCKVRAYTRIDGIGGSTAAGSAEEPKTYVLGKPPVAPKP